MLWTVANFPGNEGQEHWKAVQNILQYLLRTKDLGLTYGGEADSLLGAVSDGRLGSWHLHRQQALGLRECGVSG